LEDMVGDLFCATLAGHRGGRIPFVYAVAEAVKPDPRVRVIS